MRCQIPLPILLLAIPLGAQQTILIAPPKTIQSGIDAANNGDTVVVSRATYREDIDFKGKDIAVRAPGGAFTNATIQGTGVGPVVRFAAGEGRKALLEGFAITGGRTTGTGAGAGIRIESASPTIRRCLVHGNTAAGIGGGIGGVTSSRTIPTSPLLEDCVVEANESLGGGGGVGFAGSDGLAAAGTPEFFGCTIRDNVASSRGGGAYFAIGQGAVLERCLVMRNEIRSLGASALDGGGGVWFGLGARGRLVNTRLCANASTVDGGGLKVVAVDGVQVLHTSLTGNLGGAIAAANGTGAFDAATGVTVTNSILWQNGYSEIAVTKGGGAQPMVTVAYCALSPEVQSATGIQVGAGTFVSDPRFASARSGNLRLLQGSPCIDRGDDTAPGLPATDLDGGARKVGQAVDVGADEHDPQGALLFTDRGLVQVANPGAITVTLAAGVARGALPFAMVPGISGTVPGLDLGPWHLPLNFDAVSAVGLFFDTLDAKGERSRRFELGLLDAASVGLEVSVAAAVLRAGAFETFSNGASFEIVTTHPIPALNEEAVALAKTANKVWFDPSLSGGAHTWIFNSGEFAKAAVAHRGDPRLDTELLEQIRYVLQPTRGLSCTGGFQDQKQLCMTTAFLLAKRTPRIWNQLTATEKDKIDTTMYAALVSSAFVTSDNNPYVKGSGSQRTLDGTTDIHRDWNPNYRNGMLGTTIVASLYFGSDEAQRLLKAHDHAALIARCRQLDLRNILWTYENPKSTRPSNQVIESTHQTDYKYYGIPLTRPMDLYLNLTEYTYNRDVHTGLNNGQGVRGSSNNVLGGYMVKGQAGLPNLGVLGMLTEFESGDAGGPRSSAHYGNDGWYPNNYVHYVLVVTGAWEHSARADRVLDRIAVGVRDLLYKLDPDKGGGYHNLSNGEGETAIEKFDDYYGHRINRAACYALLTWHAR